VETGSKTVARSDGRAANAIKRLPDWVANRTSLLGPGDELKRRLRKGSLVTVCEEARCPNLGECFSRGTATFMLLGESCTRRCGFCSVKTGRGVAPDADEPGRVAEASLAMGLKYIVVTSVARDDLPDEGAGQFVATIRAIKSAIAGAGVEVLTPDFNNRRELIAQVVGAAPEVFSHNMETVERLTPSLRGRARYDRSLSVLLQGAELAAEAGQGTLIKTALMVGLGETRAELSRAMRDIRETGCQLLAVGQYLRPTREQQEVDRYVEPQEFVEIAEEARELGFSEVASGPLVRSSYRADALYSGEKIPGAAGHQVEEARE
jgi:lipoic acid synthetase